MDNKKRRTLAAVLAAAMVAATASVPAFATDNGNTNQASAAPGGQVIVPSVKSAEETPAENETTKAATMNNVEYDTLQAAIDAAQDNSPATITLKKSVTESITISANKDITIELNECSIINTNDQHTITNNGTLTIRGNGTVDNVSHGKAAIFNNGTCTLEGGTYTRSNEAGKSPTDNGENSYYTLLNHGTMTINEGVEVNQGPNGGAYSSLIENGWQDGSTAGAGTSTMTIYGGTFSGGLNTIKNDDRGKLIINGGTFTNMAQSALLNWNEAEITDGEFNVNNGYSVILNGKLTTEYDSGTLTISGGTFGVEGQSAPALSVMGDSKGLGNVTLSGGTFNGNIDLTGAQADDSVTFGKTDSSPNGPTINGGILCGENAPENLIKVTEGTEVSVPVANEEALKSALAGASEGTTIKLGADIDCSSTVTIPAGVTLDGGGHTLRYSGDPVTEGPGATFLTASSGSKIQNITIDTDGNLNHAIQFYDADGGTVENATINGGAYTSILVNGSQDIAINNCTLNPDEKAYANVEYSLGNDELTKIPSIEVSNINGYDTSKPLIYMDQPTIDRVKKLAEKDPQSGISSDASSNEDVLKYIQSKITASIPNTKWEWKTEEKSDGTTVTYPVLIYEKPSTPSTGGGSSSTQKPLEGIALSMTSTQVGPGDTLQMNVTYTPSDTTASKRVTWTSSDEDVVTVDRNGKVTATGKSGKATITATVGGKTATCTITINPFKVDVEDLNGAVTSCKADGSTVIKVPQSMSYNFDISSGVTLDSFDYTVGNDKVGGTNTIARWNGTSGKYQIYAAGAVGSQTGVYVNGVKLFTIEVTERPFTSDTTLDMSLKVGTPYMFRITPDDKDASFTFLTADGKALSTSYKAELYPDEKGDYYCTVTPLQANRDIGVYCVIGGNTYKVFTVHTIA